MRSTSLLLTAGAALSFLTAGHAATLNVASYSFPGNYEIVTTSEFSNATDRAYYELVNTGGATLATVTLIDTNPEDRLVSYAVYEDSNTTVGQVTTGGALVGGATIAEDSVTPFFTFLMAAGGHYILELARTSNGLGGVTTGVSAVPLPGAVWLFGSALLGFLGWSSRRRS